MPIIMDIKTRKLFRIILASIIIGGATYLSVKYLMKGSPFMKVGVLFLLILIIYLTVDFVIKRGKKDRYGE